MIFKNLIRAVCAALSIISISSVASINAFADGMVSQVVSAPVFANGILRDERSGINIFLQNDQAQGLDFMDPSVLGYGIPPGGSMEVEMVSGFQRDPAIPLDDKSILLVAGAPQQGLPDDATGHSISEGSNPNTFVITANGPDGLSAENLVSPAPGAREDPIPQRGIKIVHVGRVSAFISRGEKGVVEVRIKDSAGNVISRGGAEMTFLAEPTSQIFLTNIPHNQRNHNWQRLEAGKVVGAASGSLPLALLVFDKNEGLGKKGIFGAGVMSKTQLERAEFDLPLSFGNDFAGLILRDVDGNRKLDPKLDEIIGIVHQAVPEGAEGQHVLSPLVNELPFLSVETSRFNERAGKAVGGTIMQVVYITGSMPGKYRLSFSMFVKSGDLASETTAPAVYTIVAE